MSENFEAYTAVNQAENSLAYANSGAEDTPTSGPIFEAEATHLTQTSQALRELASQLVEKITKNREAAAEDRKGMSEELTYNATTFDEALETYAAFSAVNRIVDAYNLTEDINVRKLNDVQLLLKQPYFAKVSLQFKPNEEPKELYIGAAGASDENCKRLVVDWRSPVAETYYNQDMGSTSYVANGRRIHVDLKLRRQFDITGTELNAYFDTSVAIQDALLLASLSQERTAHMHAITASIQKEQNLVVRHEDVPALLVAGIAGSGKTSVLLQRIAYLFYQQRETLNPREVCLITPNPVFRAYIADVLPELGERNPETTTWNEFAARLIPPARRNGDLNTPLENLERIDEAVKHFTFEDADVRDIRIGDTLLISANVVRQALAKYRHLPGGAHQVTLVREDLEKRLEARLAQMAASEKVQGEMLDLSLDEQLELFHETLDPQNEQELRQLALNYVREKYALAFSLAEQDEWLRIDRVGMRLLGKANLSPVEWLYLKIAITGMGKPETKYVMIDEVQDYTAAQLAVLARYFRRAHFMLLGDEHQAIKAGTASFAQVRQVFEKERGGIAECKLLTSYRSSPEITALFASLLPSEEQMRISSVQPAQCEPILKECATEEEHLAALCEVLKQAQSNSGLTAVIVPWKHEARRLRNALEEVAPNLLPPLVDENKKLPEQGVVFLTLPLAKGLEFDHVIIPDASERLFPADDAVAHNRLYTSISRATRSITILARGKITPILQK